MGFPEGHRDVRECTGAQWPHLHPCPSCSGTWKGGGGGGHAGSWVRREGASHAAPGYVLLRVESRKAPPKQELALAAPGSWAVSPGFRAALAAWQLRRERYFLGTSLVVQWLGNLPSYAGEAGSILDRGN